MGAGTTPPFELCWFFFEEHFEVHFRRGFGCFVYVFSSTAGFCCAPRPPCCAAACATNDGDIGCIALSVSLSRHRVLVGGFSPLPCTRQNTIIMSDLRYCLFGTFGRPDTVGNLLLSCSFVSWHRRAQRMRKPKPALKSRACL